MLCSANLQDRAVFAMCNVQSFCIAQIYFDFFLSMSSVLKFHFKYISEKYIKLISEKYIKSRLKVYFLLFSLKEVN